ncbi:MAG: threonine synthase [Archangium sp.]|nr:threonine synthase [Archangium sp.]
MRCHSTRGTERVSLVEAIAQGLAPDGGLYVPESLPRVTLSAGTSLADTATALLQPYFADEVIDVAAVCRAAFTFDAPLRKLSGSNSLLELFHGPTAAFKDFGARFLAECVVRLPQPPKTILVATSGDTGAAVAAAFHRKPGVRVVILYPDGRVSARQAHQLGAFGDNVHTFRVAGTFDDCQRLVKAAFADEGLRTSRGLGSANSISLGRLLPQMAYYAQAALTLGQLNVVVPTGNLGNALACLMAKRMGLPIGDIALATNANRTLPDFLKAGRYAPQPSVATLANAMDVGAPSNVERLQYWYPDAATIPLTADSVDDATIRDTIRRTWKESGIAVCPHTACGLEVLRRIRARGGQGNWVVAATAHPAKFDTVVEPLIGQTVPVPPALAELLARPSTALPLEASDSAFHAALTTLP